MIRSILILSLCLYTSLTGATTILETKRETFSNTDCLQTDTCDLTSIIFEKSTYRLTIEGVYAYGTRMFVGYQTTDQAALERYVVVQFIKGCKFNSVFVDGKVQIQKTVMRSSFGEIVPFNHPQWQIDTNDTDPAYYSDAESGKPRHYNYIWNETPGIFDLKNASIWGQALPPIPWLYVRDLPGSAQYIPNRPLGALAMNTSLQFKTCVYKAKDVPLSVPEDDILSNVTPVKCFTWNSSFIFNFATKEFSSPEDISPICSQE